MTIERKTLTEQHYLYVDRECAFDPKAIGDAMSSGFGEVFGFAGSNDIAPLSMPMSVYMEMPSDKLKFRAGVMVSAEDAARATGGNVKAGVIAAGEVLTTTHVGPYATLNQSHKALWDYADANKLPKAMPVWEVYVDDPTTKPEAEVRTEIFRAING